MSMAKQVTTKDGGDDEYIRNYFPSDILVKTIGSAVSWTDMRDQLKYPAHEKAKEARDKMLNEIRGEKIELLNYKKLNTNVNCVTLFLSSINNKMKHIYNKSESGPLSTKVIQTMSWDQGENLFNDINFFLKYIPEDIIYMSKIYSAADAKYSTDFKQKFLDSVKELFRDILLSNDPESGNSAMTVLTNFMKKEGAKEITKPIQDFLLNKLSMNEEVINDGNISELLKISEIFDIKKDMAIKIYEEKYKNNAAQQFNQNYKDVMSIIVLYSSQKFKNNELIEIYKNLSGSVANTEELSTDKEALKTKLRDSFFAKFAANEKETELIEDPESIATILQMFSEYLSDVKKIEQMKYQQFNSVYSCLNELSKNKQVISLPMYKKCLSEYNSFVVNTYDEMVSGNNDSKEFDLTENDARILSSIFKQKAPFAAKFTEQQIMKLSNLRERSYKTKVIHEEITPFIVSNLSWDYYLKNQENVAALLAHYGYNNKYFTEIEYLSQHEDDQDPNDFFAIIDHLLDKYNTDAKALARIRLALENVRDDNKAQYKDTYGKLVNKYNERIKEVILNNVTLKKAITDGGKILAYLNGGVTIDLPSSWKFFENNSEEAAKYEYLNSILVSKNPSILDAKPIQSATVNYFINDNMRSLISDLWKLDSFHEHEQAEKAFFENKKIQTKIYADKKLEENLFDMIKKGRSIISVIGFLDLCGQYYKDEENFKQMKIRIIERVKSDNEGLSDIINTISSKVNAVVEKSKNAMDHAKKGNISKSLQELEFIAYSGVSGDIYRESYNVTIGKVCDLNNIEPLLVTKKVQYEKNNDKLGVSQNNISSNKNFNKPERQNILNPTINKQQPSLTASGQINNNSIPLSVRSSTNSQKNVQNTKSDTSNTNKKNDETIFPFDNIKQVPTLNSQQPSNTKNDINTSPKKILQINLENKLIDKEGEKIRLGQVAFNPKDDENDIITRLQQLINNNKVTISGGGYGENQYTSIKYGDKEYKIDYGSYSSQFDEDNADTKFVNNMSSIGHAVKIIERQIGVENTYQLKQQPKKEDSSSIQKSEPAVNNIKTPLSQSQPKPSSVKTIPLSIQQPRISEVNQEGITKLADTIAKEFPDISDAFKKYVANVVGHNADGEEIKIKEKSNPLYNFGIYSALRKLEYDSLTKESQTKLNAAMQLFSEFIIPTDADVLSDQFFRSTSKVRGGKDYSDKKVFEALMAPVSTLIYSIRGSQEKIGPNYLEIHKSLLKLRNFNTSKNYDKVHGLLQPVLKDLATKDKPLHDRIVQGLQVIADKAGYVVKTAVTEEKRVSPHSSQPVGQRPVPPPRKPKISGGFTPASSSTKASERHVVNPLHGKVKTPSVDKKQGTRQAELRRRLQQEPSNDAQNKKVPPPLPARKLPNNLPQSRPTEQLHAYTNKAEQGKVFTAQDSMTLVDDIQAYQNRVMESNLSLTEKKNIVREIKAMLEIIPNILNTSFAAREAKVPGITNAIDKMLVYLVET